uniref:Uncharacterized protein n=1 Tax=Utricularia reniformis TaxID=192314 RepID=A0A1Y0B0R4_9LAMI|nr:hypothetical protein AEK19_MT0718 [Utricularia reniformis]ART30964.1 hypothetical protein AEK19_MT0718 [Utricularia reniformis]
MNIRIADIVNIKWARSTYFFFWSFRNRFYCSVIQQKSRLMIMNNNKNRPAPTFEFEILYSHSV